LISKDIVDRYSRLFSRASRTTYVPVVVVKARNAKVWDDHGKEYIDFSSSAAVANIGYNNERIVNAIKDQVDKLVHYTFIYGFTLEPLYLAEKLAAISPIKDSKIIYGLSGSDANEGALLLARAFSRRSMVISYQGSFHGSCYGTTSISGIELCENIRRCTGIRENAIFIPYPDCYRCPFKLNMKTCKYYCIEYLRELLETKVNSGEVAAIFAEPIQGDGGIIIPPDNYFYEISRIAREHNILLVFDEVQTSLGRTGKWFCFQHYNVVPDIFTLGKPLGGGLPISAIIGRSEIMDSLPPLAYSFTLSGNPVACRAALEVINEIEEKNLIRRSHELGNYALSKLKKLEEKYSTVGNVRGKGLMIGVDLVRDKETKERATKEAKKVIWRAYELGLIVFFLHGNVLRIQPPLTIEKEVLDEGISILEEAISDVEKGKVSDEVLKYVVGW